MKEQLKKAYIDVAKRFGELSHARRRKVGAIVVKDDRIISIGYNGMPAGWDNDCEDKIWLDAEDAKNFRQTTIDEMYPYTEWNEDAEEEYRYGLKTKPEVLHAESNAIAKLAKSNESGLGSDLFVTLSPCLDCAKLIYQSGIRRVYFNDHYRDDAGIEFLRKSGVEVEKLDT